MNARIVTIDGVDVPTQTREIVNANVIEVTQSVLQDMFAMIMLVDISKLNKDFTELVTRMTNLGEELGLQIHTMHEEIFNTMHNV